MLPPFALAVGSTSSCADLLKTILESMAFLDSDCFIKAHLSACTVGSPLGLPWLAVARARLSSCASFGGGATCCVMCDIVNRSVLVELSLPALPGLGVESSLPQPMGQSESTHANNHSVRTMKSSRGLPGRVVSSMNFCIFVGGELTCITYWCGDVHDDTFVNNHKDMMVSLTKWSHYDPVPVPLLCAARPMKYYGTYLAYQKNSENLRRELGSKECESSAYKWRKVPRPVGPTHGEGGFTEARARGRGWRWRYPPPPAKEPKGS